jgi:hypothetical protein
VCFLFAWLKHFRFFKDYSNFHLDEEHSLSAEPLRRPRPDLLFVKIDMGDISSGNMKFLTFS